jgi:TP901 family phage tail tape measure protein
MGKLTASMVVDLKDRTGNTTQSIIGNLDRLKRAERDRDLAERGFSLNRVQRAQEREMIARQSAAERMMIEQQQADAARRARMQAFIVRGAAGVAAAGYVAARSVGAYAELERQMTRIGITAGATAEQTQAAFTQVERIAKDLSFPSVEPAIEALDTLVASGQSLEEALAFLPSVLATAQASGASTSDIANTALKAASALKIEASELQRAFDIMVTGGNAGQFELKDMAQFIPGLANSFASLGYEGEEGLKRLIAVLQTIREDTGDASSAATQAQNIFGKIYSGETANAFKKMGVDLRKELKKAKAAGDDTLSAFLKITEKALKGDMSKLPLLFTDQEFRLGMQSLLTSEESLRKFIDTLNSAEVNGTVFRSLNRVMSDTQSSIDRMANSWEQLQTSLGKAVAPAATAVMDTVSEDLDYGTAIRNALRKRGMGYWESESWIAKNLPLGGLYKTEAADTAAYEGGSRDPELIQRMNSRLYEEGRAKPSTGRQNQKIVLPEFPGRATGQTPVPTARPSPASRLPSMPQPVTGLPQQLQPINVPAVASMGQPDRPAKAIRDFVSDLRPSEEQRANFRKAMGIDVRPKAKPVPAPAQAEDKPFISVAGYDVSGALANAAARLMEAATAVNRLPLSNGERPVAPGAPLPFFPGKQADDLDVGRKVTIDGTPSVTLSGTPSVTLSGTPMVTIANPPPRPNITFNMPVTIHEAANAQAVAQQLGQAVRSEMDGLQASTNDSGL